MEYQEYSRIANEVARLDGEQKFVEAVELLRGLVESDISDLDKSIMCYNAAMICGDKLKLHEDAQAWYDTGIAYEAPYFRFFVTEHKAAYLANSGYPQESLAIYEHLMLQPYVQEVDKERIWNNVVILRNPRKA